MMTEIPETGTDLDYGFDDDFILGAPPMNTTLFFTVTLLPK
jgi:hypothetical protein